MSGFLMGRRTPQCRAWVGFETRAAVCAWDRYDDASENGATPMTRNHFKKYLLSIGICGSEVPLRPDVLCVCCAVSGADVACAAARRTCGTC
eukprot:2684917-Rhodomonas_salina.5